MTRYTSVATLEGFAERTLVAVHVPEDEAKLVAATLADADRRGLHSHGVLRLRVYTDAVSAGGIVPGAPMRWEAVGTSAARLDAADGFGQTAMSQAVAGAAELAAEHGCATVGVHRSSHFGAGAIWGERLAALGQVGIVVSNTGPSVAPFGSRDPILGTNPITIAVPTADRPFVLDMASSEAAYGKIVAAAAADERIPTTWAVDSDGTPTNDPAAALSGALLAFGGHKGSGLATSVELLAAALTGAQFSDEITDMWTDPSAHMRTGHLVIAIRPLVDQAETRHRASGLLDRIRASRPAAGHDRVHVAGDLEQQRRASTAEDGILIPDGVFEQSALLASSLGIAALETEPTQPERPA
jgi:LDH2 family malate/lactate/ureidoglycolate dehydrogenase